MVRNFETLHLKETHYINDKKDANSLESINVHMLSYSQVLGKWTATYFGRPHIIISIILAGQNRFKNPQGQAIVRNPNWVKITDLSTPTGNIHEQKISFDRYYILLDKTPLLLNILEMMFHDSFPGFYASNPEKIISIFEELKDALSSVCDNSLLAGLTFKLLSELASQLPKPEYPSILEKALDIIEKEYTINFFNRNLLAGKTGISVSLLGRLFKKYLNTTVNTYIENKRLSRAKHLLEFSNDPISVIAERCGYSSSNYFARTFKQNFNITPLEYRKTCDLRANFA
jgi:two-component system response regulator YesN